MSNLLYRFHMRPLNEKEGGGFVVEFPDLPGCVADGETEEEALHNAKDAVDAWIDAAKAWGKPIPEPSHKAKKTTGQWVQRVPASMHLALKMRAETEGVSLNQLVSVLLAQSLGKQAPKGRARP